MKKFLLLFVACLLIAPLASSGASADGATGWNVSVKPTFAFSGDTVNVSVTSNNPGQFAFLQLISPNGTVISDNSFTLDEMGTYWLNVTLPYWLTSGTYNLTVIAKMNEEVQVVAITPLAITLDEIDYQNTLHLQELELIDRANIRIDQQAAQIIQLQKSNSDLMNVAVSALMVALGVAALFTFLYKSYVRDHVHREEKKGRLDKLTQGIDALMNPPPKGTVERNLPGVAENLFKMQQAEEGTIIEPTLTLPCKESDTGCVAVPVNIVFAEPLRAEIPQVEEQVKAKPNPNEWTEPIEVSVGGDVCIATPIKGPTPKSEPRKAPPQPMLYDIDMIVEPEPTIFDRAHARFDPKPAKAQKAPEPEPIIIPAGLSAKEHTELVLKAQKQGKRWVEAKPVNLGSIICPWNAASDYEKELRLQAGKEGRMFIKEPKPESVIEKPIKRTKRRSKGILVPKLEGAK